MQSFRHVLLSGNVIDSCKKKEAEREIEFFSEKTLEAILTVPDVSSKKGRRDLVFMILLYDAGARIQEMLDLRLNDLHISSDEKYVVLTGKGGKLVLFH